MNKAIISLSLGALAATISIEGASARGLSSFVSAISTAAADSIASQNDRASLLALPEQLLAKARVRTETEPSEAGSAAPDSEGGRAAPPVSKDGKKPADKDSAREKSGPEPLPLAF